MRNVPGQYSCLIKATVIEAVLFGMLLRISSNSKGNLFVRGDLPDQTPGRLVEQHRGNQLLGFVGF